MSDGHASSGMERSAKVTVEDFEDCEQAGKQTQNALYALFKNRDVVEFEITIRSVDTGGDGDE